MNDMTTLPRSVVAALVDPHGPRYIDDAKNECKYCYAQFYIDDDSNDLTDHEADCPVRIAQEALGTNT